MGNNHNPQSAASILPSQRTKRTSRRDLCALYLGIATRDATRPARNDVEDVIARE